MRFDIRNTCGLDPCNSQGFDGSAGLAINTWSKVARLLRAVVVDGRTTNDSVDIVLVPDGIRQPAQDDDARATPKDSTVGVFVESAAMTIR